MILMNFLRALADLGFYYTFAGFLSTFAGGKLALALLLFQSACFALSSALRRSRIARTAALAPALLLVFLPAARADLIVSLPPAAYLAYLAWTDNYQLSWRRQVEQLTTFLRVFLFAALFMIILAVFVWDTVLSAVIPTALVTVAASVLLTRSLRLDPAMYLQPRYQLVNFSGIVLLAVTALVLGSEQAVRAAVSALGFVYKTVIAPVLLGVAAVIGALFSALIQLLQGMVKSPGIEGEELPVEKPLEGFEGEAAEVLPPAEPSKLLDLILLAVGIITAAAVLFLLFRWMTRPRYEQAGTPDLTRSSIPEQRQPARRVRAGAYAYRIRRQYQGFLRLCRSRGMEFRISDTSTDIGEKSLDLFPDETAMAGLRDIYQQARYQGEASREDYRQFKRLLGELKKARTGRETA